MPPLPPPTPTPPLPGGGLDKRSLLLLVATCLVLVFWYPLMNRLYPPKPIPATNTLATARSDAGLQGITSTNPASPTVALPPAAPPDVAVLQPGFTTTGMPPLTGEETELTLENEEARYHFTSRGGGIREVELKGYEDWIVCRERTSNKPLGRARMNRGVETPMFTLLGLEKSTVEPVYRLSRSNDIVIAQRDLPDGLRVVKEFTLGTNHLLHVTTRLQNWSPTPRPVPSQEWVFGTAAPLHASESPMYIGLFEHDGNSSDHIGESWFANRYLGCIPGTPRAEYLSPRTNTIWAAIHNQFFATIVLPEDQTARVFARHIHLSLTNGVAVPLQAPAYQTALLYGADEIPPQQERVRNFSLYVGPKEYRTLAQLGHNADVVMGFDNYFGGRFSGFFARMLLLVMNALHRVGFSYALAIITITAFVRLLFWPLMQASARTSKRMAALQPQIKELQAKYKDNPQKLNQKMLELWREHKVNPASGCLPVLIQFPILLGFYSMLQTAIELRGQSFLWACDLSQSDTIAMIPGLNFPLNPLPLLMGATMLWQARLTPMSPSMDPAQQKIMKYMPLMFMVFLYNFSAGLTLYWTVSNLFSILQMKLTRAKDAKTGPPAPAGPPARGRQPRPGGKSKGSP